jgi:hypothetical protein
MAMAGLVRVAVLLRIFILALLCGLLNEAKKLRLLRFAILMPEVHPRCFQRTRPKSKSQARHQQGFTASRAVADKPRMEPVQSPQQVAYQISESAVRSPHTGKVSGSGRGGRLRITVTHVDYRMPDMDGWNCTGASDNFGPVEPASVSLLLLPAR